MRKLDPAEFEALKPYAYTPQQQAAVAAFLKHRTVVAAAKATGVSHQGMGAILRRVQANAARTGFSPGDDERGLAPVDYHVERKTIHTREGPNGRELVQIWTKTRKDVEALQTIARHIVEELAIPRAKPVKLSRRVREAARLLAVYPIGDHHTGMMAWGEETLGDNYDLHIARDRLVNVTSELMAQSPTGGRGVVVNVGDFFHADNHAGVTERGGNLLDVDSRWPKMIRTGVAALITVIDHGLSVHSTMHVANVGGNHDRHSAYMLSLILDHHYRDDPRVTVDTSPAPFLWYEWERNLMLFYHGHRVKPQALAAMMAATKPEAWGRTRYRWMLTGHVHHDQIKDFPGAVFESFTTLCPQDAYAASEGYVSRQAAKSVILKPSGGWVSRHSVDIVPENEV